jgi:hypothetical protein
MLHNRHIGSRVADQRPGLLLSYRARSPLS